MSESKTQLQMKKKWMNKNKTAKETVQEKGKKDRGNRAKKKNLQQITIHKDSIITQKVIEKYTN